MISKKLLQVDSNALSRGVLQACNSFLQDARLSSYFVGEFLRGPSIWGMMRTHQASHLCPIATMTKSTSRSGFGEIRKLGGQCLPTHQIMNRNLEVGQGESWGSRSGNLGYS